MQIRDRIKAFRRVPAASLRPNPRNWRTHPRSQQDAMRGMLAEIGYAGALVARELDDGSLELIDGHLRAELTPDAEVPVLVVDLGEEEAAKLLALYDPLGAMAEANEAMLDELVSSVTTENEALRKELDRLGTRTGQQEDDSPPSPIDVPELYQIVVECADEDDQRSLYEQLTAEGRKCRLMNL